MKTSREQVLEFVRLQRAATASDISRALQMTQANARHHLSLLESQGLVMKAGQRRASGRGRPKQLYSLTTGARGQNLIRLGMVLLDKLLSPLSDAQREIVLDSLAQTMIAGAQVEPAPGSSSPNREKANPLTQRLLSTVQVLNSNHYDARWEARASSPMIILGNCPYEGLVEQHPELCRFDHHFLKRLTGTEVEQVAKRVPDSQGVRHCVFLVGKDRG